MPDRLECEVLQKARYINTLTPTLYLVPFSGYLTAINIVNLKSELEVTRGYCNWYYLKACVRFPIRLP